jgi:hypothetical protein
MLNVDWGKGSGCPARGRGRRKKFFDSVKGFLKREQNDTGFAYVALLSGRGVQLGAITPVMQR